ncbi:MAG TPA: cation transporter [Halothiobacillus sp.]|nr:MAG: cobalt transporter [Halothiobacillus sp. 20-54-6]HQT42631.1 cation transporter [Halothiobacillus sp.]
MNNPSQSTLHRAIIWVAVLNFSYFWVEFAVAQSIGSVSLFADSIDFLEDTAINGLILFGLGLSLLYRARLGMLLAGILLIPGIATLWMAWHKFVSPVPPDAFILSLTGFGALLVNLTCAILLVRFRSHSGSLTRAAFLSARNDVLANIAIIGAGLTTLAWVSAWPDLVVGLGIFLMNLDAARDVYQAARREHRSAMPSPRP